MSSSHAKRYRYELELIDIAALLRGEGWPKTTSNQIVFHTVYKHRQPHLNSRFSG